MQESSRITLLAKEVLPIPVAPSIITIFLIAMSGTQNHSLIKVIPVVFRQNVQRSVEGCESVRNACPSDHVRSVRKESGPQRKRATSPFPMLIWHHVALSRTEPKPHIYPQVRELFHCLLD